LQEKNKFVRSDHTTNNAILFAANAAQESSSIPNYLLKYICRISRMTNAKSRKFCNFLPWFILSAFANENW